MQSEASRRAQSAAHACGSRALPLLHVSDRQGWRQWLDFAGVTAVDPSRGPVLNQASMAIDAAVDGQGVALARTALAAWDLIGTGLSVHSTS
jgi:DNA-binding transcriptional LysR family regulator